MAKALTKAQQVEEALREAVRSGKWQPGEMLPPERDLLADFGVSRATLRNAMFSLANEGLVVRKHGSGTYVAPRSDKGSIAILAEARLLSSRAGLIDQVMVQAARECIEAAGYRAVLVVGQGDSTAEDFIRSTQFFEGANLSRTLGVINTACLVPIEDRISQAGVPCVTIGGVPALHKHCVLADIANDARLIARGFAAEGHRDFAVMYVDYSNQPPSAFLHKAIRAQWETRFSAWAPLGFREDWLVPVPSSTVSYGHAYDVFVRWWRSESRPNAIYLDDESMCEPVARAIRDLSVKTPDDLCVMASAIMGITPDVSIPLTLLEGDSAGATRLAWEMLRELAESGRVQEPVVYVQRTLRKLWPAQTPGALVAADVVAGGEAY